MNYSQFIKYAFDKMKCKNPKDVLTLLPIYDSEGALCGYLRPVTKDYRETLPDCAEFLAKWRNENQGLSVEPFFATEEGTEKWLDTLLDRDDRILFLILAPDGQKIGHLGFSSFSFGERCCEVDAVVRGEKGVYPGMMSFALKSLIQWGIRNLKLEIIRLRVFSDNERAIEFYKRNEFYIEQNNIPTHPPSQKVYLGMRLDPKVWEFQSS